ncbi:MAG: cytochrome c biogenesis protein CcsA [Candidatus Rokubacteria bacterium]|nr:cytochrome c biogenesis protein CcsA [Candidatus Rokubacteria bacterium]
MTRWLGWLAALGLLAGLAMGFGYAPKDAVQGNVQRIFYLHVPLIVTAYLAFGVVFVASITYLWRRDVAADRLAHASGETGVIFTGLAIMAGSIWGKPTWGTWWTWDARLTSTAILFLIYVGYLLLRGMVEDREQGARYAAVVGILGAVNIPIVHFSVSWWRTLHQPSTLLGAGPAPISPPMKAAWVVNQIAFVLLCSYFVAKRLALRRLEEEIHA